ncbi:EGF-like domain-containing protein [Caerostris darwini]|uniref:EGF-like domain-containing protein n=1 Tax=Caerostris darwini TaxID=1538125 RepID=A0AAV4VUS5_9ARAC|nr:EGF-like domain-containing protein [Caerostris darwini]
MNSTVKVLLLIVYVLMYASIVHCASVSKNSIKENQTDVHSIHSNYKLVCEICGQHQTCYFEAGEKKCKCNEGYADDEGTCKQVCMEDSECQNGGSCLNKGDHKFCKCKDGVIGDKCEDIVDCLTGIYKDCTGENGKCTYNVNELKAECTCTEDKKLHDKEHICKVCEICGQHQTCYFEAGQKKCKCNEGYADDEGTCKLCQCGDNEDCSFEGGEKICSCKPGYLKDAGICKICLCGGNENCSFRDGEKIRSCKTGYAKEYEICKSK